MKVKYVHFSEPEVEKIHDTKRALKNNPFIHMTQKEFDEFTLRKFEQNFNEGYILRFEVINNG